MAQLLKDNKFLEYCKVLKVTGQSPGDPERRVIEKSFRKLALRTHPDKVKILNEITRFPSIYNLSWLLHNSHPYFV